MHGCRCAGSLQAYDQSLSTAPKCAAVHCNKAAALAKLERHEEAIAAAKQALSLNKNYSKVRFVDDHHLMKIWHAGMKVHAWRIMLHSSVESKSTDVGLDNCRHVEG